MAADGKVSWIGSAAMPPAHIIKIEDARTGQWLRHLDPVTDPVKRIDMGWTMGDYNQLDIGIETVALRASLPSSSLFWLPPPLPSRFCFPV